MEQSAFVWQRHERAEQILLRYLQDSCGANRAIASLQSQLLAQTSTRLFDWIDHFIVGHSVQEDTALREAGFVIQEESDKYTIYHHLGAQLPRVVLRESDKMRFDGIAVRVDSIAQYLCVRGLSAAIEGSVFSRYRRCCVQIENGVGLWIVERRGSQTITPEVLASGHADRYQEMSEKWKSRPRFWEDEESAIEQALIRVREISAVLGQDMAACLVLEAERDYWQARNSAAKIQKSRQDSMGFGWANHDHHTFRSSRKHFPALVALFEALGFAIRERFYAGLEAGWGAQVMENPRAGIVLFLDLDLSAEEVAVDFAHQTLPDLPKLGTIGLWCALHGDSILQAGMHHLEAQFLFDEFKKDLSYRGIAMMEPFSNFSYLKQAFTEGERWKVDPKRVKRLLEAELITPQESENFLSQGAIGSHLENLQRREGYKGFNQKNVSYIISQTDPRATATLTGA